MNAPALNLGALRPAPTAWSSSCSHSENKLHQLSPYIGKLKSSIARTLIESVSVPGDTIVDPFCGAGTIPLEAALLGRKVFASDASRYAVVLTSGKLAPPESLASAETRAKSALHDSLQRPVDLRTVPKWVRAFFHPETLRQTVQLADELLERGDDFLLSCLLGILHHQRPGFLSYPSSHLVPYRRTALFPPAKFPELYEFRSIEPRLLAKISRALKTPGLNVDAARTATVVQMPVAAVRVPESIDAIVTSPPYMNALDYQRDNRLRLWLLNRNRSDATESTERREAFSQLVASFVQNVVTRLRPGGHCVLVVGEHVRRKRMTSHPASEFARAVLSSSMGMELVGGFRDEIPDVRRARRDAVGTKHELVLTFRRRPTSRR